MHATVVCALPDNSPATRCTSQYAQLCDSSQSPDLGCGRGAAWDLATLHGNAEDMGQGPSMQITESTTAAAHPAVQNQTRTKWSFSGWPWPKEALQEPVIEESSSLCLSNTKCTPH